MLPQAFQEKLIFWYYDTHKHAKEDGGDAGAIKKEQAEKVHKALCDHFHSVNRDKLLPVLHHARCALDELKRARHAAEGEGNTEELMAVFQEQEQVVRKLTDRYM